MDGKYLRFSPGAMPPAAGLCHRISARGPHLRLHLALGEIVAVTHAENARSQRVLDKLGLVRAGLRLANGSNLLFYRLNRDTFSPTLESP